MILVRDVFTIVPESMRKVRETIGEGQRLMRETGIEGVRAMTDLTGEYFTLVLESIHTDLGEWEKGFREAMQDSEIQAWYSGFRKHVQGGRREVYTLLE